MKVEKEVKCLYSTILFITVQTATDNIKIVAKLCQLEDALGQAIGETENYRSLENLFKGSEFSTLNVIGYIESPPCHVSYLAEGEVLSQFIRKAGASGGNIGTVLRKCGSMLGFYHFNNNPEEMILNRKDYNELRKILYKSGHDHIDITTIEKQRVRSRYTDFTPWNIIIDKGGGLTLLDPPYQEVAELIHNDLARFRFGLVRTLYHPSCWNINRKDSLDYLYESFLSGYMEATGYTISADEGALIDAYEIVLWRKSLINYRDKLFKHPRNLYSILTGFLRIWELKYRIRRK